MAADEVGWAFEVAAVEVQVAAAEGGASDFEYGVGRVLQFGDGAVFDDDLRDISNWKSSIFGWYSVRQSRL